MPFCGQSRRGRHGPWLLAAAASFVCVLEEEALVASGAAEQRSSVLGDCSKCWLFILRYAFIEFASFEDAKEALNSCNKREIEGRAIRLELQGPRGSPNARSRKLLHQQDVVGGSLVLCFSCLWSEEPLFFCCLLLSKRCWIWWLIIWEITDEISRKFL